MELTHPGSPLPPSHMPWHPGIVLLVVTDAYGQASSPPNQVVLIINPVDGPTPVVNGGVAAVNATAGTSPVLNSDGTVCPGGDCSTFWSLSCPDGRGSFANRSGNSVTVTTGGNSSYNVNTAGASQPFNCELRAGAP